MAGRNWIILGALLAAAGVTAGAMGTHLLEEVWKLPEDKLKTYEVAVRYQMYHALGLVMAGLLMGRARSAWLSAAAAAFLLGIVLFSGGIYAWLATDSKPLVQVVPVGGTAWILGWVLLAVGAWRVRPTGT
jgi:uncharacterized membrane protein YgdD (TMEM256/DUF423 family)